jgi:EmrB/QacA subfamily drug resistance transporter
MLIIGRAVQGFGGALISPAALSIITTTFEEGAPRNKALGVWSAIAASGAAFGLIIGGALTQAIDWRWAFFVNVPVGIVTWLLAARLVPNSKVHGESGVDVIGAVAVTAGLMSLVYALAHVTNDGWGSSTVLIFGAIGLALIAGFIAWEMRYRAPLVRLSIFRIRSLSAANGAMFLVAGGMFAMFFFTGLYVQIVKGYSPLQAGVAFLPVTVGIGVGAGIASQSVRRADVRVISGIGLVLSAIGYLLLTRLDVDSSYVSTLLPALIVLSVGMGMTFVPVTLLATTNLPVDDAGLASGLLNTSQQIGGSLGLAVLATLAASQTNTYLAEHAPSQLAALMGLVAGYKAAFLAGAILLLVSAVVLFVFVRRGDVEAIRASAGTPAVEGAAA